MLPGKLVDSRMLQALRLLEIALAALAALLTISISAVLAQSIALQQPLWVLPGMYLIELVAVTCIGAIGIAVADATRASGAATAWLAVGVLSAFSVLGAMSIGFFYIPCAVLLALSALLSDARRGAPIVRNLLVALLVAVAQGALMLAVVLLQ